MGILKLKPSGKSYIWGYRLIEQNTAAIHKRSGMEGYGKQL